MRELTGSFLGLSNERDVCSDCIEPSLQNRNQIGTDTPFQMNSEPFEGPPIILGSMEEVRLAQLR
jgi:hypothetical protein